jgi:hypothetical protein
VVAIVVAMVIVVLSVEHDSAVMMPVSVADANSDAADIDAFRDDHRLVAGVRRTGECRHCQKRNNKKGKHSILHSTLFG